MPRERKRDDKPYRFRSLDTTVIDLALLEKIQKKGGASRVYHVIIDVNLIHKEGRGAARERASELIAEIVGGASRRGLDENKSEYSSQYLFARLSGSEIKKLVAADAGQLWGDSPRAIYKIWLDIEIEAHLTESVSTIKADAALSAFSAAGSWICWAVIDSGIAGDHRHFQTHRNLHPEDPVQHVDFTGDKVRLIANDRESLERELVDEFGHGTHVAGIIAGETTPGREDPIYAVNRERDRSGRVAYKARRLRQISGVAPRCRLVSLRVLDAEGRGRVSNLIAAIGYVQKVNENGRWPRIHGVNLSVGYEFDAEWFGCGQSPLCVEVNRLVRAGTVAVAAAGNTGYGIAQAAVGDFKTGLDLTINDPGNAALAITVGATHRNKPHLYGVSYFSSKGPTVDGRLKPDIVAPGEKILSCAAGRKKQLVESKARAQLRKLGASVAEYREESGTSMAAPHVSGAIAAFLSVRREFVGEPEKVKEIFLSTATDLGRERYFQGHGLLDLMRAIQSV